MSQAQARIIDHLERARAPQERMTPAQATCESHAGAFTQRHGAANMP
jgi:hypothetical protein